ncbi:MAG: LLM class flavin-dependent oxidoreductase [Alphaproteobacteria bacterium]
MRVSVLDQSPIPRGSTAAEALADTVRLAQACEALGYHRYWLAEHHSSDGLAGVAPEVLIARVAAATSRIRVGAGGVMLGHYSPLKVAETFRLLENLFPGRIDLGLGRAPGSDPATAHALAYGSPVGFDTFPQKLPDLLGFLTDKLPDDHPFARVAATPRSPTAPELWMLGSSEAGASYAAHYGLPFAFAHFIQPEPADFALSAYRRHYRPSPLYPKPRSALAVFAIAADSDEKAERLALARHLWRLRIERGELGPYPSDDEAAAYPYTPHDRARMAANAGRTIAGRPEAVKARIDALVASGKADELVIVSICHDFRDRLRSYELLAKAYGLDGALR